MIEAILFITLILLSMQSLEQNIRYRVNQIGLMLPRDRGLKRLLTASKTLRGRDDE